MLGLKNVMYCINAQKINVVYYINGELLPDKQRDLEIIVDKLSLDSQLYVICVFIKNKNNNNNKVRVFNNRSLIFRKYL